MKALTLLVAIFVTTICAAQADIRITMIDPTTNEVQLTNIGDANQDVGSYVMCNFPAYNAIGTLTGLDTDLDPASSLSFIWPALSGPDGECGLYSSANFGSSAAMVDYVEWGSAGHTREGVAVGANVWFAGEFIAAGVPMVFIGGQGDHGSAFWQMAQSNVRITNVDLVSNTAHLTNFGSVEQDVSLWYLCNFPAYQQIQNVTSSIGDFVLSPGETVLIEWSSLDGQDGEFGLYNTNVFGNTAAIEDYVQWGSAGHQREAVADAAGVWNVGEFIDGGSPFSFTGGGADVGVAFWSFSNLGCTYDTAENYDPSAEEDDGSCIFTPISGCVGDLNQDLVVDTSDLLMFLGVFGAVCI